jgi:signal transduction histidine kinase
MEMSGDLTGVWDRDRIYQLLTNLVGNAVQHGAPRSPIGLRAKSEGDEVLIEVLGLGLFIAQQIARSHGGLITATSAEHEGTIFRLILPRSIAVAPV